MFTVPAPKPDLEPRAASLDWVRRALAEQLRDNSADVGTRAENLVAIAEHYLVPIEDLVKWIHLAAPKKQWTAAEFRRFASLLSETRRAVLNLRENDPFRQLCPSCRTEVAHRVGNALRCARCGEIPLEAQPR